MNIIYTSKVKTLHLVYDFHLISILYNIVVHMHLILLSLLVYMLLHKLRVKKDHYLHKLSRIFALSCLL